MTAAAAMSVPGTAKVTAARPRGRGPKGALATPIAAAEFAVGAGMDFTAPSQMPSCASKCTAGRGRVPGHPCDAGRLPSSRFRTCRRGVLPE